MSTPDDARDRIIPIDDLRQDAGAFQGALAAMSLYPRSQFEVVLVRGPNRRNDFHIDPYDELFLQLEGTIRVDTRERDLGLRRHLVHAGELFLVPGGVPHSPLRPAGTWGLVVEIRRQPGDRESVEWYCDRCDSLIEQVHLESSAMVESLSAVLSEFEASQDRRTCGSCGAVLPAPRPFVLDEAA